MSMLLPPDLHKILTEEIQTLAEVHPYASHVKGTLNLNPQSIAVMMLSSRVDTEHCDAFFKEWFESDKDVQCPDHREDFTRGMLATSRLDAVNFLDAHLYSGGPSADVSKKDLTEAVSVELVVTIIGNLIMRDLQLARDEEVA